MYIILSIYIWLGAIWYVLDTNYNVDGVYGLRVILIWPFVILFWSLFGLSAILFILISPFIIKLRHYYLRKRGRDG